MSDTVSQAALIGGAIFANIAVLASAWVSVRVAIAELKVKVERLETDVNNLGNLYREKKGA